MSVPTRPQLRASWILLDEPAEGRLQSMLLHDWEGNELRVAIDESGARHFLVGPTVSSPTVGGSNSPLVDQVRSWTFGGPAAYYLDVTCKESSYWAIFDDLIVSACEVGIDAVFPAESIRALVTRWRSLFRSDWAGKWSFEQEIGLFAELIVLREIARSGRTAPSLTWTGPFNLPHDFELAGGAIEVKAVGPSSDRVHIHGLDQLRADSPRRLDLVVVTVTASENGETIQSLVEELRQLDGAGIEPALAALRWQSSPGLRLVVEDVMHVDLQSPTSVVPRLTPESLRDPVPEGVESIQYEIRLDALRPYASQIGLAEVLLRSEDQP